MSFDEMYDEMLHDEFRAGSAAKAPKGAHALRNSLNEPSRARTFGIVASGGVACAVVGALLGGLGGEFGVTPASAQALNSGSSFIPLSSVADAAYQSTAAAASPAAVARTVAEAITSLGNSVTTLPTELGSGTLSPTVLSSTPVGALVSAAPLTTSDAPSISDAVNNSSSDPSTSTAVQANAVEAAVGNLTDGLTSVLSNLTHALSSVSSLGGGSAGVGNVIAPLDGVLGDLSATLASLTVIPVAAGPSLPVVSALAPAVNAPSGSSTSGVTKGVSAVVKPVLSAVTGALNLTTLPPALSSPGSTLPSLPTVPLSTGSSTAGTSTAPLPSLPISLPSAPALPGVVGTIVPTVTGVVSTVTGVATGVVSTVGTVVSGVTGVLDGVTGG